MNAVLSRPGASRWPVPRCCGPRRPCTRAALALLVAPAHWAWALAALALNHAVLTAVGLWPRSTALGQNLVRLPAAAAAARREVALTIDDGPDPEVTPAVLDLLDAPARAPPSSASPSAPQRHPELVREIVRRGHSVQNHSHAAPPPLLLLGRAASRARSARRRRVLPELTGEPPRFFRAPAGLRNPFLRRCCTAWAWCWPAGPAAATTRASATRSACCSGSPAAWRRRHPAAARRPCARDAQPAARHPRRAAGAAGRTAAAGAGAGHAAPGRSARGANPMTHGPGRRARRLGPPAGPRQRALPQRRPLRLALRPRQARATIPCSATCWPRPDRARRARAGHRLRPGPAGQPARGLRRGAAGEWPPAGRRRRRARTSPASS